MGKRSQIKNTNKDIKKNYYLIYRTIKIHIGVLNGRKNRRESIKEEYD